jgi:hypothetical protein
MEFEVEGFRIHGLPCTNKIGPIFAEGGKLFNTGNHLTDQRDLLLRIELKNIY